MSSTQAPPESTCHCFPPSGGGGDTLRRIMPPYPPPPKLWRKKEKKGGNNLDPVSSLPVHLMVFPDLEHWRLTFPLKLYFFAPYTLDFRKCTKQDNTAQYNVCLVLLFLFFERERERERQKHLRKSSDISTQGWSVFPFLVIFFICPRLLATVAVHHGIAQRYTNLSRRPL